MTPSRGPVVVAGELTPNTRETALRRKWQRLVSCRLVRSGFTAADILKRTGKGVLTAEQQTGGKEARKRRKGKEENCLIEIDSLDGGLTRNVVERFFRCTSGNL